MTRAVIPMTDTDHPTLEEAVIMMALIHNPGAKLSEIHDTAVQISDSPFTDSLAYGENWNRERRTVRQILHNFKDQGSRRSRRAPKYGTPTSAVGVTHRLSPSRPPKDWRGVGGTPAGFPDRPHQPLFLSGCRVRHKHVGTATSLNMYRSPRTTKRPG